MKQFIENVRALVALSDLFILTKSYCTAPAQVALDFVDLNTRTWILTQSFDLQSGQRVAIQIIPFQMAVERNHVWFTIHNTAESNDSGHLKQAPCFFNIQRSHHVPAVRDRGASNSPA